MKKKGKIKRYKKEYSDAEIDSYVQEFRRGVKEEHPDENEEVFPNDAEQLRDYILTLEENMKHTPIELTSYMTDTDYVVLRKQNNSSFCLKSQC